MRRVYDDTMFGAIAEKIMHALLAVYNNPSSVSKYSWGMDRVEVHLVKDAVERRTGIKLTRPIHAHGIGNNNAYEIVFTDTQKGEEQIVGLLHLNDDMFGNVYAYMTDIDNVSNTGYKMLKIG